MPALVTLTTDYGEREPTVASIKGVLVSQCPGVQIVDLSHQITRGSAMEGALFMAFALPSFPAGTVHLVGIAPGPAPIVATIKQQHIVCADNGIVTLLAEQHGIDELRSLALPESVAGEGGGGGQMVYGRDVLAPAAASLAGGTPVAGLGEALEDPVRLEIPRARRESTTRIVGKIMHVDRFGNLITNIHRSFIGDDRVTIVEAADFRAQEVRASYHDVPPGQPLALFGGYGYLEIACNGERAADRCSLGEGILVRVTVEPAN